MTKTRYVLRPSNVTSRSDGDVHFISARQLADLYGVSLRECKILMDPHGQATVKDGEIHLWPRYDGNYTLPEPIS